jgi:hypothetical protein
MFLYGGCKLDSKTGLYIDKFKEECNVNKFII